jgi:ubiquinol-cytochrome c reductase cytochrome c subunit
MTASPPDKPPARAGARFGRRARAPQSKVRRRIIGGIRLIAALALVGGIYTAFTPSTPASGEPVLDGAAKQGQMIYNNSCITCHGNNAQGVPGRGPSLVGVGSAAVEFQVNTGRMPATRQEAQAERKTPVFTPEQAAEIGAYIQALGGGPQLPTGPNAYTGGNPAQGGELFRVNCSSCHAFGAGGGALSSGKFAPSLDQATDQEIYAAMLTGPQNMPVFGDNQLSPQEKKDVISYIQSVKHDTDQGGLSIGRLGPVTEGLVIFLVGMVVLIFATLWIAGKS